MKKAFKSALSLLLCMIMVVSAFPISTFAEEGTDVDSDLAYSTGNAMGKIVNNLALQESERKSDDYCIADTVFNGSTASVKYSAIADCKLIVAVFDEKSGKMIGSGSVDVTADNNEATVTVDCAVPSHYEVRSYLVDSDLSALSTEYRDIYHTSAFEEFAEATPEDYEGDEVIIFDEDESDFGVLDNNVISAESSEAMSFDYDEATLTYTFKNATDEVKSLSVGEVFYYEYGESPDEFLLFKVSGISVDGSTVKIVEDENISLSDAFKFIRIDEDADFSQVDIDESELGECLSEIPSPQKAPAKQAIKDGKKTFSRGLKIAYTLGSDGSAKASIDGQMNVEISISTKLYYAPKLFGRDYCEFKTQTEFKTSYIFTVSGKIGLDKTKCRIPIPSIPIGPFLLTLSIYPIADFTGSITLGADVNESYTYTFDSETQKMNKVKETEMLPNVEINEKIEFRLGVGVELKLSLATVLGFAVSGEGGAKGTVTAVTGLGLWLDKHHSCAVCFDGTAKKFVDIKLSFSIKIVPQILEFEFTALKWSAEEYLLDFYVSVSDSGLKYGLGKCPNIEYSVEITVLDKNSLPINEADVTCSTGKCDADGDGKFDDTSAQTDESGKVTFYLKQGSHSVTVRDAADEKTVDISIIANAKSVTVTLDNSTGGGAAPTPGIIDKLQYTLYNGEATITGCSESISGDIILPSTIYGAPVTKIAKKAFYEEDEITGIIMPNTVTNIGDYAFCRCSNLKAVSIPDSVICIGDGAFENTKIYNSSSNWENGVLYISNALIDAEKNISGSYSIKKGTKVIADKAFASCTDLTRVTIPDSVVNIGNESFSGCNGLTGAIISNGVASIGYRAFYGCDSLTGIAIPSSVAAIDAGAFADCALLNSINAAAASPFYSSVDGVLFNKDKSQLVAYPAGKSGISYSIPNSVIDIGGDAFNGCKGLIDISIPNCVTSIGDRAFSDCSSLTSITIPNSVTSIGYSAFEDCSSLTSVNIPDSVTSIGGYAFEDCSSLTSVNIPDSVTSIGGYAFINCGISSINLPSKLEEIGASPFSAQVKNSITSIPDSLVRIGYAAFSGCPIETVNLPNAEYIGSYAFSDCDKLTAVDVGSKALTIGARAFENCYNLSFISPLNIEFISFRVFDKCYLLRHIDISSVKEAEMYESFWQGNKYPFTGSSIETATIGGTDIPQYLFYDGPKSLTIKDSIKRIFSYSTSVSEVYYTGTEQQWERISVGVNGNSFGTIHYGSSAPAANAKAMRAPAAPAAQSAVYTATAQNAVPGELYMLYAFSSGTDLSSLEYVAQLRADSGEVKFRYIPRNSGELNVIIVGKFGDSSVQEPVEPEYGVERLELISLPAKTEYDYLSSPVVRLKGLRLKAVYSDGTEKEITDIKSITASKVDTTKLGDQEITLTYEGVSIQIAVTVVPRKFKLVWIVDGNQTELTAAEGSKITKPADPKLEGYDFMGWSPEVPETMPAQNMTFTAVFEPIKTKISINTPSVTTVSYGFTLNLHANVTDLPEGARIVWSMDGSGFELIPSADGMTCGVKSVSKGSATITAKVVDKNGNAVKDANGNEITASQQLTSKAGFFQKLVAFFKKLFGSNMIIPYALEWIIK